MPLLFLSAWTADSLLWMTEEEAYSALLKSKWKSTLNNMYFDSWVTQKICRTQIMFAGIKVPTKQ